MLKRLLLVVGIIGPWVTVAGAATDLYDETVLRTIKLQFSQANYWTLLTNNKNSDDKSGTQTNIPATLTVDDVTYPGVGVRFRGNMASYQQIGSSQKKSFNINIDYTDPNQTLMGYTTLNLLNGAMDATFMKEVLYTNACRQQIPSAKANFVLLEINGVSWGVYANVQQLDGKFIRDWFPSNEGTRWRGLVDNMVGGGGGGVGGGGFGGSAGNKSALNWLGTTSSAYAAAYGLKHSGQVDPWAGLIHTCDVLNNTALTQLPNVLDNALNVDRALWLCAFEIVFADEDGYVEKGGGDYYLYYEPETGQINLIQFDGNESMNKTSLSPFERTTDSTLPIMYRLVGSASQYRQRYLAHVRTIIDRYLTDEYFATRIDAYRALIEEAVKNDTKKLFTYPQFTAGVTTLKSFPKARRTYLLSNSEVAAKAPEITAVSSDSPEPGVLHVTATLGTAVAAGQVQLWVAVGPFGLFSATAMADDGEHGDGLAGDNVFGVTLPAYPSGTVLRYYVQAVPKQRGSVAMAFHPAGAEHEVYRYIVTSPSSASSAVVINEVMAKNILTLADPQGQYDDWIELTNVSSQTVDLSGMYLTDDPNDPLQWSFPSGTTIAPGGFLLVWADNDENDTPGLHAGFKLSSEGETIWLYDTSARGHTLLDSVTFGALAADQAIGRSPDGQGVMQPLAAPTPLAPNASVEN
jgi:hypothetical protein